MGIWHWTSVPQGEDKVKLTPYWSVCSAALRGKCRLCQHTEALIFGHTSPTSFILPQPLRKTNPLSRKLKRRSASAYVNPCPDPAVLLWWPSQPLCRCLCPANECLSKLPRLTSPSVPAQVKFTSAVKLSEGGGPGGGLDNGRDEEENFFKRLGKWRTCRRHPSKLHHTEEKDG